MKRFLLYFIVLCWMSNSTQAQSSGTDPFNFSGPTSGSNYQWYINGNAISGATSATYSTDSLGTYWVVYDEGSCVGLHGSIFLVLAEADPTNTVLYGPAGKSSYQWSQDGSPLATTADSLILASDISAVGNYLLSYDNGTCTIVSDSMKVFVLTGICFDPDKYADGCDFDGDGVNNGDDIDDDNDGILDSEECTGISFVQSPMLFGSKQSNETYILANGVEVTQTLIGGGLSNAVSNGSSDNGDIATTANSGVSLSFDQPVIVTILPATTIGPPNFGTNGSDDERFLYTIASGENFTTANPQNNVTFSDGTGANTSTTAYVAQNSIILRDATNTDGADPQGWSIISTATTTFSVTLFEGNTLGNCKIMITPTQCPDTDGDGIANNFDLDSDGDGCYDNYEAGVTGATANGSATDSLAIVTTDTTGVGANGFANALETNGDGVYTAIYTYANAIDMVSACSMPEIIAVQDTLTIIEDMMATISVLLNDTIRDSEIDTTGMQIYTQPTSGGTATFNPDGTIAYTPAMDFNGLDTIEYIVCDTASAPNTLCDTAIVVITVDPVNDAPIAIHDTTSTLENTPIIVGVQNNDSDTEGDNLTTSIIGTSTQGVIPTVTNDSVAYTPPTNFVGIDTLTYRICDNGSPVLCDTAMIFITVTAIDNIRFLCVDPVAETVTIKNFGNGTVDIANYRLCSKFTYTSNLTGETLTAGSLNLAPGDTVKLTLVNITLDELGADIGLYKSGTFTDPNEMMDFTQWGSPGNGRESVAVTKGIWTAGDYMLDGAEYCYNGDGTTENGVNFWDGNDAPLAINDTVATNLNTPLVVLVQINDSDPENNPLTTSIIGTSTQGISPTVENGDSISYTPAFGFIGIDTLTYQICDNGNLAQCDTAMVFITVNSACPANSIQLNMKVFLAGAYNSGTGMMQDSIRAKGLIPNNQPYNTLTDFNYMGTETLSAGLTNITGNDAVVDWVLVELRSKADPTVVVATKAALVQRDGDVVNPDGTQPICISDTTNTGEFYVAVRHRNHLGAMTDAALVLSNTPVLVDFTLSSTGTYQLAGATGSAYAQDNIAGTMALWAGNYTVMNSTQDRIIYQGPNADGEEVFFRVMTDEANTNFLPVHIVEDIYERMDGNLDGAIIQQGNNADVDQPFISVGMHPDNPNALPIFIIYEQIPR